MVRKGKGGKSGDRGQTMMFVRYPFNRESDSVRMWNPETNGVVTTRDVIFLKHMFYASTTETEQLEVKVPVKNANEAKDDEEEEEEDKNDDDEDVPELAYNDDTNENEESDADDDESAAGEADKVTSAAVPSSTTRSGRLIRPRDRLIETMGALAEFQGTAVELKYLGSIAELDSDEVMAVELTTENLELSLVGAGLGGGFSNTSELKVMNYREAMASKDAEAWTEK